MRTVAISAARLPVRQGRWEGAVEAQIAVKPFITLRRGSIAVELLYHTRQRLSRKLSCFYRTRLSPSHISTDILWAWNLRATVNVHESGWGGTILYGVLAGWPFFPYKVGHFFSPTFHAPRGLGHFGRAGGPATGDPTAPPARLPRLQRALGTQPLQTQPLQGSRGLIESDPGCEKQVGGSRGCGQVTTGVDSNIYIYIISSGVYIAQGLYIHTGTLFGLLPSSLPQTTQPAWPAPPVYIYIYIWIHISVRIPTQPARSPRRDHPGGNWRINRRAGGQMRV